MHLEGGGLRLQPSTVHPPTSLARGLHGLSNAHGREQCKSGGEQPLARSSSSWFSRENSNFWGRQGKMVRGCESQWLMCCNLAWPNLLRCHSWFHVKAHFHAKSLPHQAQGRPFHSNRCLSGEQRHLYPHTLRCGPASETSTTSHT